MEIFVYVLIVFKFIQNFSLTLMVVKVITHLRPEKVLYLQNRKPYFILKKEANNRSACGLKYL